MPINGLCAQCELPIEIRSNRIKPLNFCSRGCASKYFGKHPTDAMKVRGPRRKNGEDLACTKCGLKTYFSGPRIRRLQSGNVKLPFCSMSCQASYYATLRLGEKGGNWKGGISIYPRLFRKNRLLAMKRDGNVCQGTGPHSGRLEAHHKNKNKHDSDVDNLITLCAKCHKAAH